MMGGIELTDLLPGWEALRHDYIESGVPGVLVIRARPYAALFVDAAAARLGARFAVSGRNPIPPSPTDAVTVREVMFEGSRHIEVASTTSDLFRNFYLLLADVAFDVVGRGIDVRAALLASLSRWYALLRETVVLPEQRQAGLFGELWVLKRLIEVVGASAVGSWTGYAHQSHDFRLQDVELEVKTTSSARRIHTINGIAQLSPSPDCRLYIISLRLVDAGSGGETLPSLISAIRSRLAGSDTAMAQFNLGLTATQYREIDAVHYFRRRKLADAAVLVPVEDGCPRLTREIINLLPALCAVDRIVAVTYDVDLTGLGFVDGTPEFHAVLPPFPNASPGA